MVATFLSPKNKRGTKTNIKLENPMNKKIKENENDLIGEII